MRTIKRSAARSAIPNGIVRMLQSPACSAGPKLIRDVPRLRWRDEISSCNGRLPPLAPTLEQPRPTHAREPLLRPLSPEPFLCDTRPLASPAPSRDAPRSATRPAPESCSPKASSPRSCARRSSPRWSRSSAAPCRSLRLTRRPPLPRLGAAPGAVAHRERSRDVRERKRCMDKKPTGERRQGNKKE
jgi:hypothetical protein